ncbi:MAG: molybdate transport system regulatory protein [Sulfurimonas sp.]|jgi:molybdate transport system regulatory protein|uniref:winged helix-turn-helix domain-containing protein n=1 Tax=Sulfurimonas sp. TaxID=2022749 RepID=UPI0039E2D76E
MVVKVKTWLEDDNEHLIFGGGKTQILELIDETGSISQAAKRVGMNYKKAWSHIKILQEYIEDDLVIVKKGRESGGTSLTPKAKELISKYKLLKKEVRDFSQKRFEEIFMADGEVIHCTKENQNV